MDGIAFEWDPKKEGTNRRKHKIGFTEAIAVFSDPLSLTIPDPDQSSGEERWVIIGISSSQRLLVVIPYYKERKNPIDQCPRRHKA
jgi:uncharacterized DUF497 family protein